MEGFKEELKLVKQELKVLQQELEAFLSKREKLVARETELAAIIKNNSDKTVNEFDTKWDSKDFAWSTLLQDKLLSVFGIKELRPMQLQAMNATMAGHDCLLLMPTGGGKSLCFQLPALLSKGITLIVSPLISLMEDQVMFLKHIGVDAVMLNAEVSKETLRSTQEAMLDRHSSLHLIYVTPEKLAKSRRFMNRLEKAYSLGRFHRLVIDEVHCCSQWGHDFRPDYKFLGIMKRQFPEVPLLGLTATATVKVLEDVKSILHVPECLLFKSSFNRPNLYYQVRHKYDSHKEVINEMVNLIKSHFLDQSGIVYCFSQKECEQVAADLQKANIKSACYHSSIPAKERSQVHRFWMCGEIQVVVATVAFGMGINKLDVRFVIHHSLSKSMENLYQESGRAGRDGKRSHCILFYRFADVTRQSTMVFTERTGLDNLYRILAYCIDVSRKIVKFEHYLDHQDAEDIKLPAILERFGMPLIVKECATTVTLLITFHAHGHRDVALKCVAVLCVYGVQCVKHDVTQLCHDVLELLDNAVTFNQRITAVKLINAWYGKGPATLRVARVKDPVITRAQAERVLAHMLLNGYIREDFHFTAYSTICYLLPGSKAQQLLSGLCTARMEFNDTDTSGTLCTRKQRLRSNVMASATKSGTARSRTLVLNTHHSPLPCPSLKQPPFKHCVGPSNLSGSSDRRILSNDDTTTVTAGRKRKAVDVTDDVEDVMDTEISGSSATVERLIFDDV